MITESQKTTLRNDITVTHANTVYQGSTLLQHWNGNNMEALAGYYNSVAAPQVDLWRPNILPSEIVPVLIMTEFIGLTAVKQNGLSLYMQAPFIDATNVNVRNGFTAIFAGSAGVSVTNLTALAKRPATNYENLFTVVTSGVGISSAFGQVVSPSEIFSAKP